MSAGGGKQDARDGFSASLAKMSMWKPLPVLAQEGNVTALMGSDRAGSMTGTVAIMTWSAVAD